MLLSLRTTLSGGNYYYPILQMWKVRQSEMKCFAQGFPTSTEYISSGGGVKKSPSTCRSEGSAGAGCDCLSAGGGAVSAWLGPSAHGHPALGPKKSTLGPFLQPPGVQGKDRASRLPSPHWQCQVCGWLLSLGQGALASPWIPRAWETLHASPGFLICKAGIKMLPALWQVDFRRKRVLGALVHTVHQGSSVYHGCCG